jgi:hypothetical protein
MSWIDVKGDLVTNFGGYAAGGEREGGTNFNCDRFRGGDTDEAQGAEKREI